MIYLDHNATTKVPAAVMEAIMPLMGESLNPSSVHKQGRQAKALLENSRQEIANMLAAGDDYKLSFTSSGTEANNLVLNNFLDGDIFISAIEHSSVYNYSKLYSNIHIVGVDQDGVVDLDDLDKKLAQSTNSKKLVSVMLANNETGVVQPIGKISQLARQHNAYTHSDAVQAVGKMELNINDLGVDFLSISGHKFGGLIGAGAVIYPSDFSLKPDLIGGGQEQGMRSGTENLLAIRSMALAAQLVQKDLLKRTSHLRNLRDQFEERLISACPQIIIAGQKADRLPNTSLIVNPSKSSETQLISLDMAGIAVSAGSACSSGRISKSHILSAMGFSDKDARSGIRVSFGVDNSAADIEHFLTTYSKLSG